MLFVFVNYDFLLSFLLSIRSAYSYFPSWKVVWTLLDFLKGFPVDPSAVFRSPLFLFSSSPFTYDFPLSLCLSIVEWVPLKRRFECRVKVILTSSRVRKGWLQEGRRQFYCFLYLHVKMCCFINTALFWLLSQISFPFFTSLQILYYATWSSTWRYLVDSDSEHGDEVFESWNSWIQFAYTLFLSPIFTSSFLPM